MFPLIQCKLRSLQKTGDVIGGESCLVLFKRPSFVRPAIHGTFFLLPFINFMANIGPWKFLISQPSTTTVFGKDSSSQPAIKIPEDEYLAGLEGCKDHHHGWFILSKGDTPPKDDWFRIYGLSWSIGIPKLSNLYGVPMMRPGMERM
ncbi:unnamed protein product [Sphenostylis stenocarpa]|uniref:Uncharacterized protein n=1 Tax=Sphenostylis stenocarpa TaxID=92480 RepID=A0AA86W1A6_9FABA|nr:unnamed protein product [Sphenostylis stenocarpa]